MEALDLSAGLRVVGTRVLLDDPDLAQQRLEGGRAPRGPPLKMAPLSVNTEAG